MHGKTIQEQKQQARTAAIAKTWMVYQNSPSLLSHFPRPVEVPLKLGCQKPTETSLHGSIKSSSNKVSLTESDNGIKRGSEPLSVSLDRNRPRIADLVCV